MDINEIDIELTAKAKEIFKMILKNPNVDISFNTYEENDKLNETTLVKFQNHNFILFKESYNSTLLNINEKYYFFISDKLKDLSFNDKLNLIKKKTKQLFFLIPFFGKLYNLKNERVFSYKLNYNSIIINLSKLEYDRFQYYSFYVYKLKQLFKLNQELNINQEFSIVFDDDKSAKELYKNMYDNFKGIIEPFNNRTDLNDEDNLE
jgi:hypothetical protein